MIITKLRSEYLDTDIIAHPLADLICCVLRQEMICIAPINQMQINEYQVGAPS